MKFGLREILFLLLLVAIPVGSWWFVFRPRNAQITEARKQIQTKQVKLQAIRRATSTMDSLKADIDEYNKAIEFFQSKLPQEKEIDKVLGEVWKLAQTSNLVTKGIRTLKRGGTVTLTDSAGPYAEQPIELELEGDFNEGLYSFLLALEKKPRITRIHAMNLEKRKIPDEGQVNAKIVMSIFFERNDPEGATHVR
ncbi:MAG: type 4a pilus biogenesis protein PilO [Planctomycetes bacterium]|nr:type 4a pilus biogenesis protein PilO [Planctomycetota bacterium]